MDITSHAVKILKLVRHVEDEGRGHSIEGEPFPRFGEGQEEKPLGLTDKTGAPSDCGSSPAARFILIAPEKIRPYRKKRVRNSCWGSGTVETDGAQMRTR